MKSEEQLAAARFIAGSAKRIVATLFTRPADTTAYASGDQVGQSTTAASVVPVALTVPNTIDGGIIRAISIRKSGTSLTNAAFRVHLYSASPTVAGGDNAAWSTNGSLTYLGNCDVTVDRAMTDGAVGRGVPEEGSDIVFSGQTIYALIEARGAYTPASAETFTIIGEVISN